MDNGARWPFSAQIQYLQPRAPGAVFGHPRFQLLPRGQAVHSLHRSQPLTQALVLAKDLWSPRQQRHLSYVSVFMTDIQHRAGKDNIEAYALSRAAINTLMPDLDYEQPAQAQRNYVEMLALQTIILGLQLKDVWVPSSPDTLLCDISTGMPRLVVPPHWRTKVFSLIHDLAHPVVKTTVGMVTEQFVARAEEGGGRTGQELYQVPDLQGPATHASPHLELRPGSLQIPTHPC
ncbi:uncharacterized protein [Narcine bancroftii]|uniref:uncharacterized protein n=1 Tax=Narcine bancroftii TaxID=1343680 RepID=UPI003831717F